MPDRERQLAASLAAVRARIAQAARAAGRAPDDITLIAVTKTYPASDVRLLASLGITDIGESRDQEAEPKHLACADLALRWHFVGQLQTNKARSVATYADAVHSVDRPRLVEALDRAAIELGRTIDVFLQVRLDNNPADPPPAHARGGTTPAALPELADLVEARPGVRLRGLMTVAPREVEPERAFARLRALSDDLRRTHPNARGISAGMSGDLEAAIRQGATHVRVGRGLLGERGDRR